MERISVHIPDEQREWVDHAALEIDGSRSDVIQRVIAAYRREWDGAAPTETDDGPDTRERSRTELLERVEKLEAALQDDPPSADDGGSGGDDEYDDGTVGWR